MFHIKCFLGLVVVVVLMYTPLSAQITYAAEWQRDVLTIALVPEKNETDQLRRYRSIASHLSTELDIRVRLRLVDYDKLTETINDQNADAAFFGSLGYVMARRSSGVIPLVRPVWENGSSTYSGYLFVRKDSDIGSVSDMRNRKLVLVSKNTTAGYVFPKKYFADRGVIDLESHFAKVVFAGQHESAAWAVYSGEADVGAAKNHIYNSLLGSHPGFAEQMLILAESAPVPSNGLAVGAHLEQPLRDAIQTTLLNMHTTEAGRKKLKLIGIQRFILTTDADYKPCYDMLEKEERVSQHRSIE